MKKTLMFMAVLAIMAALLVAGCGSSSQSTGPQSGDGDKSWQDAKTVKIGVAISLTGPGAQMGIDSKRGVEIALKELGNKINGKPVEVFLYDEKGNAGTVNEGRNQTDRAGQGGVSMDRS